MDKKIIDDRECFENMKPLTNSNEDIISAINETINNLIRILELQKN